MDDPPAESASPPEASADSHAGGGDTDNRGHDAASTADDQQDQAGTDLATAGQDQSPQGQDAADSSSDVEPSRPDDAELPGADVGKPLSPEAGQLTALEAERDQARQEIADLKAKNAEQAALIDQLRAQIDRQPEGADTPGQGADQPGTSPAQDASRAERKGSDQGTDTQRAKQAENTRWRRVTGSAGNVGGVSTLIGAADLALHGPTGLAVALGGLGIGALAWGLDKVDKRWKGKP